MCLLHCSCLYHTWQLHTPQPQQYGVTLFSWPPAGIHLADMAIAARAASAAEEGEQLPASVWEGKGSVLYHVRVLCASLLVL